MLIQVCTGKSCSDRQSKYILIRLEREKEKLWNLINIESCTCQNNCKQWPTILFDKEVVSYMNPAKTSEQLMKRLWIIKKQFIEKKSTRSQTENKEGYYWIY